MLTRRISSALTKSNYNSRCIEIHTQAELQKCYMRVLKAIKNGGFQQHIDSYVYRCSWNSCTDFERCGTMRGGFKT